MRERTVMISSAGKTFSVTGWKTGWICAPPEFVRAVQTVKQFLTFTAGAPWQLAVAYGAAPRARTGSPRSRAGCSPSATG